ncbi:MAG: AmmeMemoRadiSam system protein B [Halothiobacillaceae bacterium]
MSQVRPAAVAGMFYPADPQRLKRDVDRLLAESTTRLAPEHNDPPKALIAPHAGYDFSGPVAASAYGLLAAFRDRIRRVIVIGPAHRVAFSGMAVPTVDAFESPLGRVRLDRALIERIAALPSVREDDRPHAQEHALEVQLPFLQEVLEPDFSLVPIVVGSTPPEAVADLLELIWTQPDTLLVVSTDLTHFLDYETATRIDRVTSEAILRMDPKRIRPEHACGQVPLQGFLQVARKRHLHGQLLDLRNSGDTAGPRDSVVGYGAYEFH